MRRAEATAEAMMEPRAFLTAQWRHLAMLNYDIDPGVLAPFLPAGTELDRFEGRVIVSLVGFLFLKTRVMGIPIPFHRDFEEVNLRFYVRRRANGGWRRAVVFIRELPRLAIAATARVFYGENYVAVPMGHSVNAEGVSYRWRFKGVENSIGVKVHGAPREVEGGSEAEFITEHYWGCTGRAGGPTMEYNVTHPRWRVWPADRAQFVGDVEQLYGKEFAPALRRAPDSAFLAEGSAVTVFKGSPLP
jgi:uncharacterized protein YqjF (DUF2071 family)